MKKIASGIEGESERMKEKKRRRRGGEGHEKEGNKIKDGGGKARSANR